MKRKILSKILTVFIVFMALVCVILFVKIVTNSEVSIFGCRFYYVLTDSMAPTIKPNSVLMVRSVDTDKLEVGDVISFTSRDEEIYGMVNTHRILEIIEVDGEKAFVTMGDHNPVPDDLYVYPEEIKGKVVLHTPPLKGLTEFLKFSGTKMGFFIVILIPLMLILAMFLRSFIKEFRTSLIKEEEDVARLYEDDAENRKQAAIAVLELYFGKKINEITIEDIEKALESAD